MAVDVSIQPFLKELDFEKALAELLTRHGWEPQIILNPTEGDLVKNWAAIIFNNNRDINRLGDFPLTDTEMQQVISEVDKCKTPYEKSKLINGGLINIKRDNPNDTINCGKNVYLKIFDAREIRTGQSTYQIVRQPKFNTKHPLASSRRGDVMLLINGMPVVHIELKRSGVDVTQAVNQIKKYTHEGVFSTGIFSLVQVFVAMTPEKTLYFANPGEEKNFSPSYYFHWANFNNEEMRDWKLITSNFLSIPMCHQMVGFYTIADDKDETLKVLRSYQYFAAVRISDRVRETNWDDHAHKGGFVWHTTGSGKTMTSFKAAQLISNSGDADKVVFLLDRIELSTQSLDEYRGFAGENDNILDSDNTADLITKLESDDKDDCLIVTSLQKMSRITPNNHVPQSTINKINGKRVVFIVDECHRGVYGSMLLDIKNTFPRAILFGFTGTPVFEENSRREVTTETIFGDMLHKYTLANGIPDGNVLGFDLYRVDTFQEQEIRQAVALKMAEAESVEELENSKEKQEIYDKYMNDVDIMKIEDLAKGIYQSEEHHKAVVQKIVSERPVLSKGGRFHAILATKSIPEAIAYYEIFKENYPEYNVATIFDDSIDNSEKAGYKEDAILEMIEDYNKKFGTSFQQSTYAKYKNDVAKRQAHKAPYLRIEREKEKQLDLLIVVTQMLTGYDSKWVNTLYVDKLLYYVDVIQAFSRTNRLVGPEKPFGIIKYFTRPNKMAQNINDALELYVDQPLSVFVDKLESNLEHINKEFTAIKNVFDAEGITDFDRLPTAKQSRNKFAAEFCKMTKHIEAAKMQGFRWDKDEYEFQHTQNWVTIKMLLDEQTYKVLLQRYRELFEKGGSEGGDDDVYQLEAYITETGVGTIDADYIQSEFVKFLKNLYTSGPGSDLLRKAQEELHKAFATLSQRDQRTASRILHDIESGDLLPVAGKTVQDYIAEYQKKECDQQIYTLAEITGLSADKLKSIIRSDVNEQNIDDKGRYTELMDTLDKELGAKFLTKVTGQEFKKRFVVTNVSGLVRRFILDAEDRAKILFAYQNDNVFIDVNVPEELPEAGDEEPKKLPIQTIDVDKMKENILFNIGLDLAKVPGLTHNVKDVIAEFFDSIKKETIVSLDGLSSMLDFHFGKLYSFDSMTHPDKVSSVSMLIINFEGFLKKMYYLKTGSEVPKVYNLAKDCWDNPTLKDIKPKFTCLVDLEHDPRPICRVLNNCYKQYKALRSEVIAHNSYLWNEIVAKDAQKIITLLYFYVFAMEMDNLKK